MHYKSAVLGIVVTATTLGSVAEAQMAPGGGMSPMGPGGGQQPSGEAKKEGVGEEAPKAPGLLPTTPALPAPKGRRKKWKLLELDGYYRLRTDWFKNFNLGFNDTPGLGGAPFPRALGCASTALSHPCDDSLSSTNMRLRLEPTINIDEGTSVHIQADVFDNQVLGATPTGQDYSGIYTQQSGDKTHLPPVGAFGNTQASPTQGVNSDRPAIVIKRAWGEVAVPLGVLKFGRQPNHFGMGIFSNGGGADPINGTYNYDADYGDSVDRVSFSAAIPGTNLRAMIASDWDMSKLVSNQTIATTGHEGHPFNLDNSDDTNAWVGVISKMDSPQEFKDSVERGDTAYNYGVYFEYKTQAWDDNLSDFKLGNAFDSSTHYVPRDLKTYTPDLWGKVGFGAFLVEAEFVAQLGYVHRLDDINTTITAADIRRYGGTGRLTWKGVENKLHIGIESGFASGDPYDNTPQGNINVAFHNPLQNDNLKSLTAFAFNRDYFVDMILFRQLMGAVSNAAYFKPFLSYELTKSIAFKVSNITSIALKPVATPGNSTFYGTEFDGEIGYDNGPLFAGISFGVLFPFAALSHPADDTATGGTFGYGTDPVTNIPNTGDPSTAYAIQSRLVLKF